MLGHYFQEWVFPAAHYKGLHWGDTGDEAAGAVRQRHTRRWVGELAVLGRPHPLLHAALSAPLQ